jgi:hypothetical protein
MTKIKHSLFALTTLLILLNGCTEPVVEDYAQNTPRLDLKKYYTGTIEAWGILQNYSGMVTKRFNVKIKGEWEGNKGKLYETFIWHDGTSVERTWNMEQVSENRMIGRADHASGEAIGELAGNAAHWQYRVKIPVNGEDYEFDFDDWMYAITDEVIINRAKMKKFGFTVGELTLFMKKIT